MALIVFGFPLPSPTAPPPPPPPSLTSFCVPPSSRATGLPAPSSALLVTSSSVGSPRVRCSVCTVSWRSVSSVVLVDTIGPESSMTLPSSSRSWRLMRVSIWRVVVSSVLRFLMISSSRLTASTSPSSARISTKFWLTPSSVSPSNFASATIVLGVVVVEVITTPSAAPRLALRTVPGVPTGLASLNSLMVGCVPTSEVWVGCVCAN
uniref:(northern house mosquito) hypothetical protein n=1 Tax=Culex pipiens TaxID=7175 RepID=A0A8D8AEU1_CULPI